MPVRHRAGRRVCQHQRTNPVNPANWPERATAEIGTDLYAQTGPYPRGAEIHLANTSLVVLASGCLGLTYLDPGSVTLDCYAGQCQYATELGGEFANIKEQTQLTLQIGQSAPPPRSAPICTPKPAPIRAGLKSTWPILRWWCWPAAAWG